jgi:hypothetical protein
MQDVLIEFLSAFALRDKSKDTTYTKIDQLPPFNITAIFSNEYGYASFRRLLGVEFVTDGTVYSINDAFTEQTISYVCADFTPLAPLSWQDMIAPVQTDQSDPTTSREKTRCFAAERKIRLARARRPVPLWSRFGAELIFLENDYSSDTQTGVEQKRVGEAVWGA